MQNNKFKIAMVFVLCLTAPFLSIGDASGLKSTKAAVIKPFAIKVKGTGEVVDAIQTTDGSYVSVSRVHGQRSFVVRKTSPSGRRIWERSFSFEVPTEGVIEVSAIAQTNDGYVLVASGQFNNATNSAILIALNPNGTLKWSKSFVANETLLFNSVTSTADGGFMATGLGENFTQPIVVKFTSAGDPLWAKGFEDLSFFYTSQSLPDGVILASVNFSSDERIIGSKIIKVGDSGNVVWKKNLRLNGFYVNSLTRTSTNGIVLAGFDLESPLVLICLDDNGRIKWRARYSVNVANFSVSNVISTPDGGYVVTGTALKGWFILRIDAHQNIIQQKALGLNGTPVVPRSVFAITDGGYFLFGSGDHSNDTNNDTFFLHLNSDTAVPGCSFNRRLISKKMPSPKILLSNPTITPNSLSFPTPTSIQINTAVSRQPTSTACQ
jgi:hypothetical protein